MATENSLQNKEIPSTVPLFGLPVLSATFEQALALCESRADGSFKNPKGYVCFVNVHTLTESRYSPILGQALRHAWLSAPDGVPLLWLAKFNHQQIGSRICGPDFMKAFIARNPKQTFGLLGGAPGCAEHVAEKLGIQAICYSPPLRPFHKDNVREDWNEFLKKCPGNSPPAVIWVGLGAPKQELWMEEAAQLAPQTLFFGVGAAFDFLAGNKKRAPLWMQRAGLEWLFRLGSEPKRLWRRYLVTNSLFLLYALRDRLFGSLEKRT